MLSFLPTPFFSSPPRRPRSARFTSSISRRQALQNLALTPLFPLLPTLASTPPQSYTIFSVIPTSVSDVNLDPISFTEAIDDTLSSTALFLGEHHNSLVDHALQARILEALQAQRKIVVGLEMIQQPFQGVLDKYVAGEIDELDLYLNVEWDSRWVWPYESYLPVFRLCKKYKIPLIALSMSSETLSKLRSENGIMNLTPEEMRTHIGNPTVFSDISKDPAFKRYISECITPSYATHFRMGLLRETANFNAFYTSRVLRDEAMATRTVRAICAHPDALVVCIMGSDHVKFQYGVTARVQRQLQALQAQKQVAHDITAQMKSGTSTSKVGNDVDKFKMTTVMLNPGPADAFDPKDQSLKLEMNVGDDAVPIADYLWFSTIAEAKPRRKIRRENTRTKTWVLPPVEKLTNF